MKKYLKIACISLLLLFAAFIETAQAKGQTYSSTGKYNGSNAYMLATILYHEIGGSKNDLDLQQVANVVMNQYDKYKSGTHGENVQLGDILTKKWNFSFSEKYLNRYMSDAEIYAKIPKDAGSQRAWQRCMNMAQKALSGQLADITQGATHYRTCNRQTGAHTTFWGARALNLSHNGPHCFFKNIAMGVLIVDGVWVANEGKVTGQFNGGTPIGENANAGSGGSGMGGGMGGMGGGAAYDSGGFANATLIDEKYANACQNAKTVDNEPSTPPNLFNTAILAGLDAMTAKIYQSLGVLYALGNSLMCYATDVGYTCIGFNVVGCEVCFIKFANLKYWFSGLAIYLTAFFMSMTVGMYFIDVAFKIGFAMLMLPLSFALWPFEATKGKLNENISIIIRNAMLFALVSIGVSFAIILIEQGVLSGIDEKTFNEALTERSGEKMSADFSLDTTRILVILFCLIFGLKIIASSIEDYLNRIFPDNIFGGSSPMHRMGTQAVGYAQSRVAAPAMALAGDIAKNAAGHAMMSAGDALTKMSGGDFSPICNVAAKAVKIGHKIANPKELGKDISNMAGKAAQKGVSAVAAFDREMTDIGRLIRPGSYSEDVRQKEKMLYDQNSKEREQMVNGIIAQGTQAVNAGIDAITPENTKNAIAGATALGANMANTLAGNGAAPITTAQMRQRLHESKESVKEDIETLGQMAKTGAQIAGMKIADSAVGQAVQEAVEDISDLGKAAGEMAVDAYQTAEESTKNAIAGAAAAAVSATTGNTISTEQMRADLHAGKEGAKASIAGLARAAVAGAKEGAVNYKQGDIALTPGNILSAAATVATAPVNLPYEKLLEKDTYRPLGKAETYKAPFKKETYKQLGQVAKKFALEKAAQVATPIANQAMQLKSGGQIDQQLGGNSTMAQRIIMKVTRDSTKLFVRTGVSTASTTTAVAGSLLKDFGKKLTKNTPRESGYWKKYWAEKDREEKERKLQEAEQRETDMNLTDQYIERN